jgi:hypothetical protein
MMGARETLGLLAILAVPLGDALAQGADQPDEAKFSYTRAADQPILELSYEGGMIADRDPTPYIRVYGDGRAVIHRPVYMKDAGEFELQLSPEELENLLATFAQPQLLTLEPGRLAAMAAEVQAEAGPVELPGDHGVTANVDVRLERVAPDTAGAPALLDVDRRISLPTAAVEAGARAPIEPLQDFAAGIRQLEALAERPELVKLPDN